MKTLAILILAVGALGCGDGEGDGDGDGTARLLVLGTDFSTTGIASTIDIPSLEVTQNAIDGVASTDPVVREVGDLLYIINRFGADNLTVIDRDSLSLIEQVSTGNGTNPQDVAVAGGKLYVAALGTAGVLVFSEADLAAGPSSMIDLSSLDPDDGLPNCNTLRVSGARLYVACGILDDNDSFLTPRGVGQIAVIDIAADSLVTSFDMQNRNPFGFMQSFGSELIIATVPSFADLTSGCVEQISTGDSPSSRCVIDNSDLMGYASSIASLDGSRLLISVTEAFDGTDFGPLGYLVQYDLAAAGEPSPMTPSDQRPFDAVECPSGHIAVADAGGGVRIYDAAGTELTDAPLDIGLPPVSKGLSCWATSAQ